MSRGKHCEASAPPIRAYNLTMQHPKLVVVQSYASRPDADFAKGALEAAGIQAMIQSDSVGGMRNTSRGPARASKFWCARKTPLMRAKCWLRQLKATKSLTPTPKRTPTRGHHGAGLPSN
jgi:hypothetical protein